MSERDQLQKLGQYLTVSEAAEYLGVCAATPRNWDRRGKVRAIRHPVNRYRLYRREELRALLRRTAAGEGDRP